MTRRAVSLRGETYDKLHAHCEEAGRSTSGLLEELIAGHLNESPPRPKKHKPLPHQAPRLLPKGVRAGRPPSEARERRDGRKAYSSPHPAGNPRAGKFDQLHSSASAPADLRADKRTRPAPEPASKEPARPANSTYCF